MEDGGDDPLTHIGTVHWDASFSFQGAAKNQEDEFKSFHLSMGSSHTCDEQDANTFQFGKSCHVAARVVDHSAVSIQGVCRRLPQLSNPRALQV